MKEKELIEHTPSPRTRESLAEDLRALGVKAGMTLIVHSSMSKLGWVCGGPVAVVQALMDVLTEAGTLVMPTQSADLSDPTLWSMPAVPEEWFSIIKDTMPAFDPQVTPTRKMGRIVEVFRTFPGVIRSAHPQRSFAAWGRHKEQVIHHHALDFGFGEGSPLARIYELDGFVLLLGVGHDNNTTFHLAENRAPGTVTTEFGAPINENGQRMWKIFQEIEMDADVFPELGAAFELAEHVVVGTVGSASSKLFSSRAAVDFGVKWLTEKRG